MKNNFLLNLINSSDSYFNNNSYYTYKPNENNYNRIQSFIYTDRAIYRPGQTIYFKSIVLESVNNKTIN